MPDVFTPEKRSRVMAAIHSRGNRDTELKLVTIFRLCRITGWRRNARLPGKPDFVFRHSKVAIFVDGCFWHGCPQHGRKPGSNQDYWIPKLERNRARDRAVTRALRARSWIVLRFWEHDLRYREEIARRVQSTCTRRAFAVCPFIRRCSKWLLPSKLWICRASDPLAMDGNRDRRPITECNLDVNTISYRCQSVYWLEKTAVDLQSITGTCSFGGQAECSARRGIKRSWQT